MEDIPIYIDIAKYDKKCVETILYAELVPHSEKSYKVENINFLMLFYNINNLLKLNFKILKDGESIYIKLL